MDLRSLVMVLAALVLGALWRCAPAWAQETPGAPDSPVAAARERLSQLSKQGKDVTALSQELDLLDQDWQGIDRARRDLESRMQTFRPRMEALFGKITQMGGGGDPIAGVTDALAHLKQMGRDTSALETDLVQLKPEWAAIQDEQHALAALDPGARPAAEQKLRARVDAFRPKMEQLGHRVHDLAEHGGDGRSPGNPQAPPGPAPSR